jgi:hypothetical protein
MNSRRRVNSTVGLLLGSHGNVLLTVFDWRKTMMNLKILPVSLFFVGCLACLSSTVIHAQEAKPSPQARTTIRGGSYAYKLTDQDFANTPSWNQEEGEPPLSLGQAVKVARDNLPRFVKNAESWKMRQVALQSMGQDKWYYAVHFFCLGVACRETEERSFEAIVKMDGTIVEPKKVTIEN